MYKKILVLFLALFLFSILFGCDAITNNIPSAESDYCGNSTLGPMLPSNLESMKTLDLSEPITNCRDNFEKTMSSITKDFDSAAQATYQYYTRETCVSNERDCRNQVTLVKFKNNGAARTFVDTLIDNLEFSNMELITQSHGQNKYYNTQDPHSYIQEAFWNSDEYVILINNTNANATYLSSEILVDMFSKFQSDVQ
jgi:hypothetical protein